MVCSVLFPDEPSEDVSVFAICFASLKSPTPATAIRSSGMLSNRRMLFTNAFIPGTKNVSSVTVTVALSTTMFETRICTSLGPLSTNSR